VQLAFFERDADALLSALERARYLERSGRRPVLPLTTIYERYPEVTSLDAYEQLLDVEADPKVVEPLQRLVLKSRVDAAIAHLDERRALAERQSLVEWEGDGIPVRLARQTLSTEPERGQRHELDSRIREASEPLRHLALERLQAYRAALEPLAEYDLPTDDAGYSRLISDVAVEDVSALAEFVLDETRDLYADALRDQLVHHHLDDADVWEADVDWILRGEEYDRVYPGQRLMPSAVRALGDLGIRLQDQTAIRLDLERLPEKVTASFVVPIAVPDEVVVVLAPRGGVADYSALFRALGESESYAQTDRTQPLAFRRLGDGAVVEGYGQVLSSLLSDPAWLELHLEADATRDAVRLRAFEQLYRLRQAAVSHLYEVELRAAPEPETLDTLYVDRFAEALGVRPFPERFLDGMDVPFRGARRLRAAIFGHQLTAFLKAEFDEDWYRSVRAGRFLIDRWREGQRYRAEDVVQYLGFNGLDVAPLIAKLRADLTD